MKLFRLRLTTYAAMTCFAALSASRADVVTDWNSAALDAIRTQKTPPPVASRNLAILHASIFDALNGIERKYDFYLVKHHGVGSKTSLEAAASAAAHRALVRLFPAQEAVFDQLHASILSGIGNDKHRREGIEWGEYVADAILAWRMTDGADAMVSYQPGNLPGQWIPTISFGGIVRPALLPQWATLVPFAMSSPGQFRPGPPPSLDSAEYARDLNQVKDLGAANGSSRTPEQTEIALFWANGAGTATPPGHWNQIAQVVSADHGNTLLENARLFALLNIALADAAIVSWDCKYAYNLWRPITAIPAADLDGNPATDPDPDWVPLLETPPFPEYTSGHSTFSGAGAAILAFFYGSDNIGFTVGSDELENVTHYYSSFSQAAAESGISRIYGGIHFWSANVNGLSSGAELGEYVARNLLLPQNANKAGTKVKSRKVKSKKAKSR